MFSTWSIGHFDQRCNLRPADRATIGQMVARAILPVRVYTKSRKTGSAGLLLRYYEVLSQDIGNTEVANNPDMATTRLD